MKGMTPQLTTLQWTPWKMGAFRSKRAQPAMDESSDTTEPQ